MRFWNRRTLLLFIAPHVAIVLAMLVTKNTHLIGIFNVLNFAIACMVVVAYHPVILNILGDGGLLRDIDRGDWLGAGIFLGWLSTIELRGYSIAWRWLGQPEWLTDSDILNYGLFVQLCAGVLHLAAPGAINHQVPTRQWIKIGVGVGLVVFITLLIGYWTGAYALPTP